ncbi:nucleoside deaminase [Streptomyces pratensis]|uniref:nucleoside deaminase n=1 Tax=Streptomyces pratensis TaxID=1169025 RepID=UPI001932063C|nr:nucleoside deaminase [Streptomyces pratensis]
MLNVQLSDADIRYAERAVELAGEALRAGDEPFGSVLVSAEGMILREARNLVRTREDDTRHPEFELARWAAGHLSAEERSSSVVYTSGEHCPMCAAAHGWAGLGRIVYAHAGAQLAQWLTELDVAPPPVRPLGIQEIVPGIEVQGPIPAFADRLRSMHRTFHTRAAPRT